MSKKNKALLPRLTSAKNSAHSKKYDDEPLIINPAYRLSQTNRTLTAEANKAMNVKDICKTNKTFGDIIDNL